MRISKTFISRAACAVAGAALLGACSGTGDAARSLIPGARSNEFIATLPPTVISMVPQNGPTSGGNTVTLIGNQFDASTQVMFGSQAIQSPTVVSQTQVTFRAPEGEGALVPVVLSTSQGSAVTQAYHYDPPVLFSITPNVGPSAGGTSVTLSGGNFGVNPTVLFGNNAGTILTRSHTQIVAKAPAGAPGEVLQVQVVAGGQSTVGGPLTSYRYAPPQITSITPDHGPTAGGNAVTLTGQSFGSTTPIVTVNGVRAQVVAPTQTSIVFMAPAGEGTNANVLVTTSGVNSNSVAYNYDAPVVSSIAPSSGPTSGGTTVTISGVNFGLSGTVKIGGVTAPLVSRSHTTIVATTPAGVGGNAPVVVTAAGQSSTGGPTFNYIVPTPTITSIVPNHGTTAGGTAITLTGSNFGSTTPTVTFNGVSATIVSASQTQVVATAPRGEGTNIQVALTANGIVSNTLPFNYDRPSVNYIGPVQGPTSGGTQISISALNVSPSATVTVGGNPATVLSASYSGISAIVPPGVPGPAPVVVTVAGQSSDASVMFTYVATKPTVANVTPASAPTAGGTTVTVTGSNFGTAPSVTVGSAVAPIRSANNTQLTFTLPAGEGSAPIIVTAYGLASDPAAFTYAAPSIATITPSTGSPAGGFAVTLTGSNFGLHPSVIVDRSTANMVSASHTQIVFTAPAGDPGHDAQVSVTVAGQTSNMMTLRYSAPTLVNLTPSHGPTSGGTVVTLSGSGFGSAPVVMFGSSTATIVSASQTQITAVAPAGQGSANVIVKSGSMQTAALTYSYDAPSIASLTPTTGPVAGGTQVTINGANFGLSPIVMFGGTMAPLVSTSHTRLVVTTPAGAPATVPVSVTVGGKASNALLYQYVCPDGTVISNGACVTPVAALGNVVASLPPEVQTQLAPIVTDITSKLTDNNPNNDNGACGQLNALSKQTAALLKSGKISASQAAAVEGSITLVSGKTGCK